MALEVEFHDANAWGEYMVLLLCASVRESHHVRRRVIGVAGVRDKPLMISNLYALLDVCLLGKDKAK